MDHAPEHRPMDWYDNEIGRAIERVRSTIELLDDIGGEVEPTVELERAYERLVEADLWLKRHGNKGKLAG